jgi:hypothetical protein
MSTPPALRPADGGGVPPELMERATVSLGELRAVLDRLAAASPERAAFVRAVWEAMLALVEEKTRQERSPDDEDEGIDDSDIPDVGGDDAYWTGGRIGPVLPPGTGRVRG